MIQDLNVKAVQRSPQACCMHCPFRLAAEQSNAPAIPSKPLNKPHPEDAGTKRSRFYSDYYPAQTVAKASDDPMDLLNGWDPGNVGNTMNYFPTS